MSQTIKELAELFLAQEDKSRVICIMPHLRSDGDAISSCLVMSRALEKLGYQTRVFLDEKVPDLYFFMPGLEKIEIFEPGQDLPASYTLFVLDCHEASRLGEREVFWQQAQTLYVMDHHQVQDQPHAHFAIESDRSSTAEMVYFFIQTLEEVSGQTILDLPMASNLTTGIYMDTGGMRYSNTGVDTYRVMADLRARGVAVDYISEHAFGQVPIEEARARGLALMKARMDCDGRLVWCFFRVRELLACSVEADQLGYISSMLKEIKGTDLAIFMQEDENPDGSADLRLSFRSSEDFNAADFAQSLGGGGHLRASGATLPIEGDIYDTVHYVVEQAKAALA